MCVGENCAPQSAHYINAQLTALYQNALDCLENHENADRPQKQYQYANALAQFSLPVSDVGGQAKANLFRASFDKPQLEFVCNHDVILHLRIHEGKYYLDYTQASNLSYADMTSERVQSLSKLDVAFRVGFTKAGIRGQESTIGSGRENHIQLVVLDLQNAQLISTSYEVLGRDALVFYLSKYLQTLRNAGNHVLFSLPDFDNAEYKLTIDYSLAGSNLSHLSEICGISVHKINHYLSSTWLTAAILAAGYTPTKNQRATCLAEYRNQHFYIKLAAPRIRPLCSKEVIMYFKIDEVDFFGSSPGKYSNWEIALLLDVSSVSEFDGQVTRLKLKLPTARFHPEFSTAADFDDSDEFAVTHWTTIVDFFQTEYLEILESAEYHVVYTRDTRWGQPKPVQSIGRWGADPSQSESEKDVKTWKDVTTRTNMFGFDIITAISHSSLHAHFTNLWTRAQSAKSNDYTRHLRNWVLDQSFESTFKAPTVTLLSENKAIVWIHVDQGSMKLLNDRSDGQQYRFAQWSLAFEVSLKEVAHNDLGNSGVSIEWLSGYADSQSFTHHGKQTDRVLKHITLDLRNAEFLPEYSKFNDDLFHVGNGRPTDKVEAMVHYIRTGYFVKLVESGLHILHTIPVWTTKTSAPWFAVTDTVYHVYSQVVVSRSNWSRHLSTAAEPVLVILGVTGGRDLPSRRLDFSTNWVIRANKAPTFGTVAVSRRIFLNEKLLDVLARINGLTTLIPLFPSADNGFGELRLITWAEHENRKNSLARWELVWNNDGGAKYMWEHLDGWTYQHQDTSEIPDGSYSAPRGTTSSFQSGQIHCLEIRIWGEVDLEVAFETGPQKWSTKASARWDATLGVATELDGLKIAVTGSTIPVYGKTQVTGTYTGMSIVDPTLLLKKHLNTFTLDDVVNQFQPFEGTWQGGYSGMHTYSLASPVFNTTGDLLFSLRHREQPSVVTSTGIGGRRVPSAAIPRKAQSPISRSVSSANTPDSAMLIGKGLPTVLDGNGHANGIAHPIVTPQYRPILSVE
ncbi:hypothetical protein B0H21DRAFT_834949 [Amylocystis lapponica]|nr:hypothetical protein B0H21DRAFT_834949 [Amylocystis lapponica]